MRYLLAFLLISGWLNSYSSPVDSLKKILKTGNETERYHAVKQLLTHYISFQKTVGDTTNSVEANQYFPVMRRLAERDSSRLIEYDLYMGWFLVKYDLLKSFENIRNAIKAARESKNTRSIGECYLTAGMLMESELDYFLGLQYYFAAINYFKLLKDETKLAFAYEKVGELLIIYVQYDRALEYLTKSAELFRKRCL